MYWTDRFLLKSTHCALTKHYIKDCKGHILYYCLFEPKRLKIDKFKFKSSVAGTVGESSCSV